MQRFPTLRLTGLLLAVLATACSNEEPPPAAAPSSPPAASAQAPAAPAATAPAATDQVAVAEAMEGEETAGETASEGEPIRLAEDKPAAPAPAGRFKEGTHYRTLPVAQPTGVPPGKVEVAEIFWYGCPHCYTLEPHVEAWRATMPANVEFVRIPASLNQSWQIHARVYYTAEALGVLDQVHEELFRQIHSRGSRLDTEASLIEFFGRYGVTEAQFTETFNSFAVQTKLRQSDSLVRRYRITGVPAVVVNGKYVTGADMAGGEKRVFEVVDFLIERESS